jgi:hypothetical protein
MLKEIWPKSIKPTLLTTKGRATSFQHPTAWTRELFYAICHNKSLGFIEHHAPTSSNPFVPPEELEREGRITIRACSARSFWPSSSTGPPLCSTSANGLRVRNQDQPVDYPEMCEAVFAVMDTAVKGGTEHDGTAVVYYAVDTRPGRTRLTILDWDVVQIDGALLETWLPSVFEHLNELSGQCVAINGSLGVFIEDASMGSILLQKGESLGWPVNKIESALTSKGKDERAIMASGYHYRGWRKYPGTPTRRQPSSKARQQTICTSRFPDSTLPTKSA